MSLQPDIFPDKFLENLDAMYTLALRLTKDTPRAEELVQKTIENAYGALEEFDHRDDIKQWLLEKERQMFKELSP